MLHQEDEHVHVVTVFEAEDVPVACEHERGDAGVSVVSGLGCRSVEAASVDDDFQAGGVDAREVARA